MSFSANSVAARARTVWVTAQGGVTDHAVLQLDLARWTREPARGVRSICGDAFWPAPMIANPGPHCFRCVRYMRARATLRSADERLAGLPRHRRETTVRRFLTALVPPKTLVASPHLPPSVSPGEATGLHSRRDSDASSSGSEFRRVPRAREA